MSALLLSVSPSDEPNVLRTIEVGGAATLYDLHQIICAAFEFAGDEHMHAFFMNGHFWDAEFGVWSDPDAKQPATHETRLDGLGLRTNKRFAYLFDFGSEQRFDVRVHGIEPDGEVASARIVESIGEYVPDTWDEDFEADELDEEGLDASSPDESDAHEDEKEPRPEVVELVKRLEPFLIAFAHRMGVPYGMEEELEAELGESEEEEDPKKLEEEYALALEVLDFAGDDLEVLTEEISALTDGFVVDWLGNLPERLNDAVHGELRERAVLLTERLLAIAPDDEMLSHALPRYLAGVGRRDEARVLAEKNLTEYPEDPAALYGAARAFTVLEDMSRAESLFREALRFAGTDEELREDIVDQLAAILTFTGGDVAALRAEEEARRKTLALLNKPLERAPQLPFTRESPKVGRNDPCPCGSGKKFKKCCGK